MSVSSLPPRPSPYSQPPSAPARSPAPHSPPFPPPSPPPAPSSPSGAAGLVPVREAPPTGVVPQFPPLRVRRGRIGLWRLARHRLRIAGGLLALAAAAALVPGVGGHEGAVTSGAGSEAVRAGRASAAARKPSAAARVRTPVRVAEPAVLRLLRPGARVDVIAARARSGSAGAARARVVATGARVVDVPQAAPDVSTGLGTDTRLGAAGAGAVVVLAVSRATAVALASAAADSTLAVVVC